MPVYNSGRYVKEAVDSILAQTLRDFELIIVDDHSRDDTARILGTFTDSRISLISNAHNIGVPASLNRLIDSARGNYIARMDGDDISIPTRLAQQVDYMESHPRVGVCGSWCKGFGIPQAVDFKPSAADRDLRFELFFDNPIPHPTVMIRAELLMKSGLRYDPEFAGAEDYDLWVRALDLCEFAIIQDALVRYRFHAAQATNERMDLQRRFAAVARRKLALRLIPEATTDQLQIHDSVFSKRPVPSSEWFLTAGQWVTKLIDANRHAGTYQEEKFRDRLGQLLWTNAEMIAPRTRGIWRVLHSFSVATAVPVGAQRKARFGVRCLAAYTRRV